MIERRRLAKTYIGAGGVIYCMHCDEKNPPDTRPGDRCQGCGSTLLPPSEMYVGSSDDPGEPGRSVRRAAEWRVLIARSPLTFTRRARRADVPVGSPDPASQMRGPGTIGGYAAVRYDPADAGTQYTLWDDDGERAVERIAEGALRAALGRAGDVAGLFNHEPDALLGRTSSGTMRLDADARGLRYDIDLPDTQMGRDVAELVDRGDLTGSSFGFVARTDSWAEEGEGDARVMVRTLDDVDLLDVGPVTYPAYSATSAGRSALWAARALGSVSEARDSYRRWRVGEKRTKLQVYKGPNGPEYWCMECKKRQSGEADIGDKCSSCGQKFTDKEKVGRSGAPDAMLETRLMAISARAMRVASDRREARGVTFTHHAADRYYECGGCGKEFNDSHPWVEGDTCSGCQVKIDRVVSRSARDNDAPPGNDRGRG